MIDEVFLALRQMREVRSASAFSRDFLGMESNYYRSLKRRTSGPSPIAVLRCAAKLRQRGEVFLDSTIPIAVKHRADLLAMAERCIEDLLTTVDAQL